MPAVSPGGSSASDETDRLARRVLWALPTGLYVVGSRAGEERNLMTANLVVQVATSPRLVAVSIESHARTRQLIDAGGTFTVSLLRPEDRAVVRRFVKPLGAADVVADGGRARSARDEPLIEAPSGAPALARAVAWIECTVKQAVELGSHVLYVGEVSAVAGPKEGVPAVLSMADTRMNYGG